MTPSAATLITQFETANFNLKLQLGDLTNDDARRRARGTEGASISWIVGHLLAFRVYALHLKSCFCRRVIRQ